MTKEQAARLRQGDSVGYGRACVATVRSFKGSTLNYPMGYRHGPYVRLGACTVHGKTEACPNPWIVGSVGYGQGGLISYQDLTLEDQS